MTSHDPVDRDAVEVSAAIKAQNPDLDRAWRTIAWWEQTCEYWCDQAYVGYGLRSRLADLEAQLAAARSALAAVREVREANR